MNFDTVSVWRLSAFFVHSAQGSKHFHVAVLLNKLARWAPAKRVLTECHRLASHFSVSHTQWWSALRYGAIPSERKPAVDLEQLQWAVPSVGKESCAWQMRFHPRRYIMFSFTPQPCAGGLDGWIVPCPMSKGRRRPLRPIRAEPAAVERARHGRPPPEKRPRCSSQWQMHALHEVGLH